ncbi:uncharacterized protein PG998_015223 [Apiospora kogelbergensis]|uniref:uncharacterized protein n=1 Tax=Apiospora kogelbergensis TaxID=1337665 RepID=UPI00312ED823
MTDKPATLAGNGLAEATEHSATVETSALTYEDIQGYSVEEKNEQIELPNNSDLEEIKGDIIEADEVAGDGPDVDGVTGKKPKKKKKSRPKVGKKRRHITGLEELLRPPVTPPEASEEKQIYAAEIPFPQRIEECIQRYRQKRKLKERNAHVFDKYLFFGGIESSQRQFGGMDIDEIRAATTDEIRQMTATEFIQSGVTSAKFYNPKDTEDWVVDFEGVVKGFLSRYITECFSSIDPETDTRQAGQVIHNFLNYVLHHDVCPEYTANIKAAQAICQVAPDEMRAASDLYAALPDSFNTATRFLFCDGGIFKAYEPEQPASETPEEKKASGWEGYETRYNPQKLDAHLQLIIFRFNMMDKIKDETLKQTIYETEPREIRVVNTKSQAYQIVSTHRPSKRVKAHNEEMLEKENLSGKVKPTGIAMLRPTVIDHAWSNVPRPEDVDDSQQPTETFIVDDHLLAKMVVGMKMQLDVCELNVGGVRFIKECREVRPSFDTLLPQSLMQTWKDPVLNERPPPSVSSPEVGHLDLGKMAQDDDMEV